MDESRFVLYLPNVSPQGAVRVAEKIRLRIRHHLFSLPEEDAGRLTASFSAAHFEKDGLTVEELMETLDSRLREAIESGGDRGMLGES